VVQGGIIYRYYICYQNLIPKHISYIMEVCFRKYIICLRKFVLKILSEKTYSIMHITYVLENLFLKSCSENNVPQILFHKSCFEIFGNIVPK